MTSLPGAIAIEIDGFGDDVLLQVLRNTAVITINRPNARNAINAAVATGIEAAVDHVEHDPDIWIAVITGVPPAFSAGADLKEIQAGRRDQLRTARGGFAGLAARTRTKPMIAAVEGAALAGGMELCLACDLIVASRAARFGLPEVRRSLVAAAGGLFRLPERLPPNLAMEIALTGDPIDAERLYAFGLVNRLTEPGEALAGALELAGNIEQNAPIAVRATLRVMRTMVRDDDELGWKLSSDAMAEAMASDDNAEGLRAFVEKRPPRWTGR